MHSRNCQVKDGNLALNLVRVFALLAGSVAIGTGCGAEEPSPNHRINIWPFGPFMLEYGLQAFSLEGTPGENILGGCDTAPNFKIRNRSTCSRKVDAVLSSGGSLFLASKNPVRRLEVRSASRRNAYTINVCDGGECLSVTCHDIRRSKNRSMLLDLKSSCMNREWNDGPGTFGEGSGIFGEFEA